MSDVIILGAGASGLMAAVAAARSGAAVTVLEHQKKPGRKLLITGNGRCNLSNLDPELPGAYRSMEGDAASFATQVLRTFSVRDTLRFFEELGVSCIRKNGLVYPRSGQASCVLEALLGELGRLKVKLKYDVPVEQVRYDQKAGRWQVPVGGWTYEAPSLVLCCGSRAAPETGSNGSGYELARRLGHRVTAVRPALTGLFAEDPAMGQCDGARTAARIRLLCGDTALEETGELQWTSYGLSGIAIFQLSRALRHLGEGETVELVIDHVPEVSETELADRLQALLNRTGGDLPVKKLLAGYVHERVAGYLAEKLPEYGGRKPGDDGAQVEALVRVLKELRVRVKGVRPFSSAQVAAGGVCLEQVNSTDLSSKVASGLFFAGELLDIDGPCGGYNLQWAWSSGAVAGRAAVEFADFSSLRKEEKTLQYVTE